MNGFLGRVFRKGKSIKQPRLGILELSLGEYGSLVACDKAGLSNFFNSVSFSEDMPPTCDVLMLYGCVESDGSIKNSKLGLREIIRDSNAAVVIFATANPSEHYIQAGKQKPYGHANLVMTISRKGDAFTAFF